MSEVCDTLDSGKIDTTNDPQTVTIVADDGYLITGYCVKAGSSNQGDGPVYIDLAVPAESVTISHPSGKDISHYSWSQTTGSTTTTTSPPTTVSPPSTTVVPETTVPTTTESPDTTTSEPATSTTTLVPPKQPSLPETGSEVTFGLVGAGLILVGAALARFARR